MHRIIDDTPKFSIFQHREARGLPLASEHDSATTQFADEVFGRLYAGGEHEALPDEKANAKLAGWARKFHDACSEMPAWSRLLTDCRGDAIASAIAVERVLASVKPQEEPEPQEPGKPAPRPPPGGKAQSPEEIRRAVNVAVQRAEKEIEQTREALEGLNGVGAGRERGEDGGAMDLRSVRNLVARLRDNRSLRRIAELAGRFKRIAARKRRERTRHGCDEITDVETGADLGRLLPSETVKLNHPSLRLAFLRDLMERRALQYEMAGTEEKGRGPIVAVVDKSGSMMGAPDEWATAICLALLDRAKSEKRPFALVLFESYVKHVAVVPVGGTLDEGAILVGCSGGTHIGGAVERALSIVEEGASAGLRKADLVLITDGIDSTQEAPRLREKARALSTSIIGIGIGVTKDALSPWCDSAESVLRLDTMDEAISDSLFGEGA